MKKNKIILLMILGAVLVGLAVAIIMFVSSDNEGEITFLYRVEDGAMNKSYGVNVASLAGLPNSLLERAKEILKELETDKIDITRGLVMQKNDYKEPLWIKEVKNIDPLSMSPLEALNFLYTLKEKIQKEDK